MKHINLLFILLLSIIICRAQSISVSSFKLLDNDLTANTAGTMEIDQNGETAALIKVVTTQTGYSFDGGALGIVKTKQTPGEVWVYIPRGSKKISIKHPQLGVLRDYYFPVTIAAARTYEMKLVNSEVKVITRERANSQFLVIQVSPDNAVVELDNEILPVTDGIAQKFLKFGTYEYRIQAQNYHTSAGKITIDDPDEKKIVTINLIPAYGWIEIGSNKTTNGALVYIDNNFVGKAPMKSDILASGKHSVKIVQPLYHAYEEVVNVQDNETTSISPTLEPNYTSVTIKVGNNASIYVNEQYKGRSLWSGILELGTYVIEAKKESHISTIVTKDISSTQEEYNIQLDAPTPIFGGIKITSTPSMADVFIDGKMYGQTPLFLNNVLIGKRSITLKKKGLVDYTTDISLTENKIAEMSINMINIDSVDVKFESDKKVSLYLDGKFIGTSKDGNYRIRSGNHLIQAHNPEIGTFGNNILFYEKNVCIEVDTSKKNLSIKSKK